MPITYNMPIEAYHDHPAISKSGLWTIYTETPRHFRHAPKKQSKAFDFGQAVDIAILEYDTFEDRVMRGPADRRGNKWEAAQAEATNSGRLLLTAGDFERALMCRDAVHASSYVNRIITGGDAKTNVRQASAFATMGDGLEVKCRPDLARSDLSILLDLKTCRDASPRGFAKAVAEYGYHAQEAWYTDTWQAAGGFPVAGFVFLAVESEDPFCASVYELEPSAVDEGRAAMAEAFATYAACMKSNEWPGYPETVQPLALPRWAHKLTAAPNGAEE